MATYHGVLTNDNLPQCGNCLSGDGELPNTSPFCEQHLLSRYASIAASLGAAQLIAVMPPLLHLGYVSTVRWS